jgi:hypothetical protein
MPFATASTATNALPACQKSRQSFILSILTLLSYFVQSAERKPCISQPQQDLLFGLADTLAGAVILDIKMI